MTNAALTGALPWVVLAVLSAVTLVVRQPWTGLLARGRYPGQVRAHPLFHETNLIITAAWTGYFAAAAVTTALTTPWAAVAWAVPTPLMGWCSFRAGDRYAARRLQATGPGSGPGSDPGPEGEEMSVSDDQARLRREIKDRPDQEILAFAGRQPGGTAALVELTMAGMPEVLDPALAQDCVIGYEIDAPEGLLAYRVEVAAGRASVAGRAPDDARVVLQLGAADYLRLITGLADGTDLFMTGRMRIRGDLMFAPRVGAMFVTAASRG